MAQIAPQDEQRRMEDNEKASREELSERTESIFWEIEDIIKKQQNPESHKEAVAQDEM